MYFILSPFTQALLPLLAVQLATFLQSNFSAPAGVFAVGSGFFQPVPVYLTIVNVNLLADMGWYSVGRFSKLEWIKRIAPRLRINIQTIDELEYEIQQHAGRLLFLAKLTVGLPIPTLIATGLSKVPVRRWIGMLVLGELIKTAVLVALIFLYATAIQQASKDIQAILLTITFFVITAGLIWWKKRRRNRLPGMEPEA